MQKNIFKLQDAKTIGTPMSTSTKFDKDEKGKSEDVNVYRGMIGNLLYLTASRPDIIFSVYLCARFQASPKESHVHAVKKIIHLVLACFTLSIHHLI